MNSVNPRTLKPVPQTLFPTKDSLAEAVNEAVAALPIVTTNELMTTLMTYHNTLLAEHSKSIN
jgi:hypothetical protein